LKSKQKVGELFHRRTFQHAKIYKQLKVGK